MDIQPEDVAELAGSLERQVEIQAEAAKRAIHEYHRSLLQQSITDNDRRTQIQLHVEQVVREYIRLRKRLDELRSQMKTSTAAESIRGS